MTAGTALLRGRNLVERLMVDACTVVRKTGETVGAGGVITPITTTVYTGKCRIVVRTRERLGGSWVDVGEELRVVSRLELQIPISAVELFEGDKVTMTASTYDPQLVNKQYAVRDTMHKSFLTSRRVTITETSS
jgi:hypothetical protein